MAVTELLKIIETQPLDAVEQIQARYELEAAIFVMERAGPPALGTIQQMAVKRRDMTFFYPAYTQSFDAILGILPKPWRLAGFSYPMNKQAVCFLTREADGKHLKQGVTSPALDKLNHAFLHATLQAIDWERKNA